LSCNASDMNGSDRWNPFKRFQKGKLLAAVLPQGEQIPLNEARLYLILLYVCCLSVCGSLCVGSQYCNLRCNYSGHKLIYSVKSCL